MLSMTMRADMMWQIECQAWNQISVGARKFIRVVVETMINRSLNIASTVKNSSEPEVI